MPTQFVLLTAAKNEEQYISYAIQSVVRQTIQPMAWFIVDDGSTDKTAHIVHGYSKDYPFIHLISRESGEKRSFGAQYRAINMAYQYAQNLSFDFIGVQDADIELAREDYYEQVISAFSRDVHLGVAGGYIFERKDGRWLPRLGNSPEAVAGGIQMFRRSCFEQIKGYLPLLFGGEDWLAQIDAKRAGWAVYALPDLPAYHYRSTSSADGKLKGLFRLGMMDASFGSHPIFELFKCARRVVESPFFIGTAIRFLGYLWWNMSRRSPLLSAEKVSFLRNEQMSKLLMLKLKVITKCKNCFAYTNN